MKRRRPSPPRLFLKGKSSRARRRLLAVFLLLFAPATARRAPAACLELPALPLLGGQGLPSVTSIWPGELSNDPRPKLLVVSNQNDILWLGDVLGTAQTVTVSNTAYSALHAEAGDIDGDGDLDVVTSLPYSGELVWYRNDGSGDSWSPFTFSSTASDAQRIHLADVDGDGDPEVVARFNVLANGAEPPGRGLNPPYSVLGVWEFDGDPTNWNEFPVDDVEDEDSARAFASGDFDGDGDLDLVEASALTRIVLRRGNGVFGFGVEVAVSTSGAPVDALAAADVDRDGDLDLIAASESAGRVDWFENVDGNGGSWAPSTISTALFAPRALAAHDLDQDGDLDVLAGSSGDNQFVWFENTKDGVSWCIHTLSTSLFGGIAVAAADLDRDGDLDPVGGGLNLAGLARFRNDDRRGLPLHLPPATIATTFSTLTSLELADLDRDGDLDAVASASGDSRIDWYQATSGAFLERYTVSTLANGLIDARPADIDGDGDPDLIAANYGGDDVLWFENGGDPTVDPWTLHTINGVASNGPKGVVPGDLDRDGDLDVVVLAEVGDDVHWYRNNGDGTLWTLVTISELPNAPNDAALADLDRDGDLDVAVAARLGGTISWFTNDGTPEGANWVEHAVATPGGAPESIAAADLDADRDLDLVVSLAGGDAALWYENDGDGSGWALHTIGTGLDNVTSARVADTDADGDLDVVTAALLTDDVVWFLNDGTGAVWSRQTAIAGLDGAFVAVPGDVDRDGDLDLVTGFRFSGGGIVWQPNATTRVYEDGFDSDGNPSCWSEVIVPKG